MAIASPAEPQHEPTAGSALAGALSEGLDRPEIQVELLVAPPLELGILAVAEVNDFSDAAEWHHYKSGDERAALRAILSNPGAEWTRKTLGDLFPDWIPQKGRGYVVDKLLRAMKRDKTFSKGWEPVSKPKAPSRWRHNPSIGDDSTADMDDSPAPPLEDLELIGGQAEALDEGVSIERAGKVVGLAMVGLTVVVGNVTETKGGEAVLVEVDDSARTSTVTADNLPELAAVAQVLPVYTTAESTLLRPAFVLIEEDLEGESPVAIAVLAGLVEGPTFEGLSKYLKDRGHNSYPTTVWSFLASARRVLARRYPDHVLNETSIKADDGLGDIMLSIDQKPSEADEKKIDEPADSSASGALEISSVVV